MSDWPASALLEWYRDHGRALPWRETRDAYRIWLSEVILQQTRIAQGTEYYLRFVERFPAPAALAAAREQEVLRLWQGLGYYSRARNLHAAARQIVERYGGAFPRSYQAVRALPGVGDYTAAAICSIAYGMPLAAVDGNAYRVLGRLFDLAEPIDTPAGRRTYAALAQECLDEREPGRYNQAMMDFGALQCTPSSPRCDACPLSDRCMALGAGMVALRPVKAGRVAQRERWFHYFHILCQGKTLLHRREGRDIWQGLYEFPLVETAGPLDPAALAELPAFHALFEGAQGLCIDPPARMPAHRLTHQTIHARFYRVHLEAPGPGLRPFRRIDPLELDDYPLSRLTLRYLEGER